jgi:uncharacterized protein YqiB (DUF1249 family)
MSNVVWMIKVSNWNYTRLDRYHTMENQKKSTQQQQNQEPALALQTINIWS